MAGWGEEVEADVHSVVMVIHQLPLDLQLLLKIVLKLLIYVVHKRLETEDVQFSKLKHSN